MELRTFRALTFDCYGTLIDWERGILEVLRPWAERHGIEAPDEALLERYGQAEARLEQAEPALLYPDVLRGAQTELARLYGVPEDPAEADAFARSIRDWPPFPDSAGALHYLKRHFRSGILSNVDRESFRFSNERLGVAFDLVVTAQEVGSYKPKPGHFHEAFRRLDELGVAREEILHVAQSLYHDIAPATALGLKTVWVDRRRGKGGAGLTPPAAAQPDLVVASLAELVELHKAQSSS